jgi:hypothetical protein
MVKQTQDFNQTDSQRKNILEFMQGGPKIDGMMALQKFGTMKLASRVSEIIAEGYDVQKGWKVTETGKRVREYWLLRPLDESKVTQ